MEERQHAGSKTMSTKAQIFVLVGTALVAMLVGAASYTLYRLWPRTQPPQTTITFKPEEMETYGTGRPNRR